MRCWTFYRLQNLKELNYKFCELKESLFGKILGLAFAFFFLRSAFYEITFKDLKMRKESQYSVPESTEKSKYDS
jgi:hypothetical protein